MSIIDTEKSRDTNAIFHVPSLHIMGSSSVYTEYSRYHWEYLAHGFIEGDAHMAVSFHTLVTLGLPEFWPGYCALGPHSGWGAVRIPQKVVPLNAKPVRRLLLIGRAYGPHFQIPMTIALMCLTRRSSDF